MSRVWRILALIPLALSVSACTDDAPSPSSSAAGSLARRIAFVSDRDGKSEIHVMSADGTDVRRLTDDPAHANAPAWSPDGASIAFLSDRDGNFEIYLMNADGTGVRRLTDHPGNDDDPAWSMTAP